MWSFTDPNLLFLLYGTLHATQFINPSEIKTLSCLEAHRNLWRFPRVKYAHKYLLKPNLSREERCTLLHKALSDVEKVFIVVLNNIV